MLQQRQRRQFKGRVAKEAEQGAIQQRRLRGGHYGSADKDQNSHHVKQIEQDRGRGPDFTQHVADLRGEKALGDKSKKHKIDRDEDDQGRQIENNIPVHSRLQHLLRMSITSTHQAPESCNVLPARGAGSESWGPSKAIAAAEDAPCCTRHPSDTREEWHLEPTHPDWAGGLREAWAAGRDLGA